ncbi:hypothetical protein CTZ27_17650 [Streptomyces griseocarneus]|nr:hypothetical protein CTZ27_17650 [Streptomyces griseocarneus]
MDETHEGHEGQGARRTRTDGPRHAAPRKPLLARLHMPAGKAVALAAMPTAVLMGMGLTPQLASAKPTLPEPFEGQCATVPDASASPSEAPSASPKKSEEKEGKGEKKDTEPSAPSTSASAGPAPDAGKSADAPEQSGTDKGAAGPTSEQPAPPPVSPSPSPSPSSSTSKPFNPLDPLGLGDKLKDILTGGHGEKKPAEPSSAETSPSPSPSPSPSASPSSGGGKAKPEPGVRKPADGPSTAPSSAGPSSAPSSPGASTSTSPSPGTSSSASPGTGTGTLPPCPKPDVVDEKEGHAFPVQPWYLETSALTLHGLTYEGIKKIKMVNGQEKNVLKFTADAVTIKDLHQIVNTYGRESHITGPGTNSTITGGKVTMYTEELKGKLLGLIPTTQSPTQPPPLIPGLKVPIPLLFTDVKLRQGGQFGGTLHIQNLHQYYTDGTYP